MYSLAQVVVKSQILAGGRGLGTFKNGLQGGVHICSVDEAPKLAEQMLGQVGGPPALLPPHAPICSFLLCSNALLAGWTIHCTTGAQQ
jgi:succinyl-CoA synthetase beta subunit